MKEERFGFRKVTLPWVPFVFCAFLSGMVMVMLKLTGHMEWAFPAFFCFLPMTFFFVAVALVDLRKDLKHLSDRIQQLEEGKK